MNSNQKSATKGTILIVDDIPENLRLLSKILTKYGYQVKRAINGLLALKVVHSTPPELILLDIKMPQMNGYEVCRELKASEQTREIPVIFLSVLNDVLDKVKAFDVGGADYITKPFHEQEILARIEHQLTIRRQKKHLQQEICDRQQAETALRRSEAKLLAAQRVAHFGNWEFDLLTQQFTWSEELFCIFGLDFSQPEPSYIEYLQLIHPDDRELMEQTLTHWLSLTECPFKPTSKSCELDFRIVRPDGSIRYIEAKGEPILNEWGQLRKFFGVAQDITQRKQVEEALRQSEARERDKATQLELTLNELKRTQSQLVQSEKMSSLGQMVAGVAHEINNPISFIYGNLDPASKYFQDLIDLIQFYQQTYPNPTPEIEELTEEIELDFLVSDWQKLIHSMQVGAERIREIVSSLKNFSRQSESALKPVDIHEGIDNTLLILQHRLRAVGNHSSIEVIKEYGQLPLVSCYASELNQVFMNLLSNAIDALAPPFAKNSLSELMVNRKWSIKPNKKQSLNPKIWISTKKTGIKLPHQTSQILEKVVIRIADNGPGINEQVIHRIFEPFFTTKPVGSGTGLGLSISYQIVVERHRGKLSCFSVEGQGTEFIVEIPVNTSYPTFPLYKVQG
ncbi:MAG: response regulator [Symploca sp. SIO2C1]|nr:response regulator [Symploca sp. SIO2C1]